MANPQQYDSTDPADQFAQDLGMADQPFARDSWHKGINRNVIILGAIAAVAGSLIYAMYLRGGFTVAPPDPDVVAKEKEISDFTGPDATAELATAEKDVDRTLTLLQSANAHSRPAELNVNPFASPEGLREKTPIPSVPSEDDTRDIARAAASHIDLQGIICGTASSCTINGKPRALGEAVIVDGVPFTIAAVAPDHIVLHHARHGNFTVALPLDTFKPR